MLCRSLIKIRNLVKHMKNQNKTHQNSTPIDEKLKTKSLMICKISNFNTGTAKHLAQASCTELTLSNVAIIFCSSDREKLLKFQAEGLEFTKKLKLLHQYIGTVKS